MVFRGKRGGSVVIGILQIPMGRIRGGGGGGGVGCCLGGSHGFQREKWGISRHRDITDPYGEDPPAPPPRPFFQVLKIVTGPSKF